MTSVTASAVAKDATDAPDRARPGDPDHVEDAEELRMQQEAIALAKKFREEKTARLSPEPAIPDETPEGRARQQAGKQREARREEREKQEKLDRERDAAFETWQGESSPSQISAHNAQATDPRQQETPEQPEAPADSQTETVLLDSTE